MRDMTDISVSGKDLVQPIIWMLAYRYTHVLFSLGYPLLILYHYECIDLKNTTDKDSIDETLTLPSKLTALLLKSVRIPDELDLERRKAEYQTCIQLKSSLYYLDSRSA